MTLKQELEARTCTHRLVTVVVFLVVAVLTVLAIERWRGERALQAWKEAITAQGEVLDPRRLWPPPSAESFAFSNQLALALGQLPEALEIYAGQMSGMVWTESGRVSRGSQEPRPLPAQDQSATQTWQHLSAIIHQAKPALRSMCRLMEHPPSAAPYDIVETLQSHFVPNFVDTRRSAQALHAAAICDLHKNELTGALDHLVALAAFARLYAEDPCLLSFMIRVAILGLSVDAGWDALQASGYTEPQLAALQQALQATALLQQMPRTQEGERAARLYHLDWLRTHSYDEWLANLKPVFDSVGWNTPALQGAGPGRLWRQWVFHPVWGFAWADQEELNYLRHAQLELTAVREASRQGSWLRLNQWVVTNIRNYRPPVARWRFYARLPLVEETFQTGGGPSGSAPTCPYPDFSRAWWATFKNLTLHQMMVTAIALKRCELRRGQLPASLAGLVPEFLPTVPIDLMDGQPLRYRLNPNGSFLLYSVGEDIEDDGGNPQAETPAANRPTAAPWTGRDWVWPQAVND